MFQEYTRLLCLRAQHCAFHPDGAQRVMQLEDGLFGIERTAPDHSERLVCINNLASRPQQVAAEQIGESAGEQEWYDLIEGQSHRLDGGLTLTLRPWQTLWLTRAR